MSEKNIKRRDFFKRTVATIGAAGAVTSAFSVQPPNVMGANEKIVIALIGCGGMGKADLKDFLENSDVQCAAVCDVYEQNLGMAREMTGGKAKAYNDFRRLFDEGQSHIDAVIVATPDHWHALPMIMACEAGKDVYVEKPLSLSIGEGRKMVEAARKYNRVVQTGMQQRSGAHFQRAVKIVQSGQLGEISLVRCWNYGNEYPDGMGTPPDSDPPQGLDWDFYLGPAPKVPFNKNRFLGTFRSFWDYSGGMLTDWGTHLLDIVNWAMNVDAPKAVHASGGKYFIKDNRETPDTIEATFEYPNFICTYFNTVLNNHGMDGNNYGIQFYGTNGTLYVDRSGYEIFPEYKKVGDESVARIAVVKSGSSEQHKAHVRNFLDCVKSRQKPVSEVEICHHATLGPHLANIAYKMKQRIEWDEVNERITNIPEANQYLLRPYRAPWKLPD